MSTLQVMKKGWIGIALCVGLVALPLAARADASAEVATAAQHAGFSAAAKSLMVARMHLHHTLNCLVGPKGHGFYSKAGNPCAKEGHGAIPDTTDAHAKRELEHLAYRTRMALRGRKLPAMKKEAAMIEAALKKAP